MFWKVRSKCRLCISTLIVNLQMKKYFFFGVLPLIVSPVSPRAWSSFAVFFPSHPVSHPTGARRRPRKLHQLYVGSPLGLMAVLATHELIGNWPRSCFLLDATWFLCARLHGWSPASLLRLVIEERLWVVGLCRVFVFIWKHGQYDLYEH